MHCVFSTKDRRAILSATLRAQLWPYLGGIAKHHGFLALAVGGAADHVHILISLPATISIAKAIQELKAGSSKWIHDTFPELIGFAWQEGYGAFSLGISQLEDIRHYIENQAERHKTRDFQAEFLAFLQKHGIDYDPRYVLG